MLSIDSIRRDFFYSLRSLKKSPGFAVLAILALALGIGANAAIFSVVYSLMFRPIPGATQPEELVSLVINDGTAFPSAPDYVAFQDYASLKDVFVGAAGATLAAGEIRVGNEFPERILPFMVSGNYFDLLGVKMALGRTFHQEEVSNAGNANVAVVAYDFWKRRLAGNPNAIGSVIQINGNAFTIVGVAS